jgi:NAD(P)-dependent dehydrogenase (short-subunit alcohol dehydrogenase family)
MSAGLDRNLPEAVMTDIRFDGRVAVVTGAGSGLGRAHALELARRGARVVVNDPGGDVAGQGGDTSIAERVAAEIRGAGGQAVADTHSVGAPESAKRVIQTAIDAWGRIDILVNNAGILRDKTLAKMDMHDFDHVVRVHLGGSAYCTHAALAHMQAAGYGRIVFTTSSAGLYGNFGQANYAAAKMGLVGLMNALRQEIGKYDIRVNTVAPVAVTRMTEGLPFADLIEVATPERVSPAVIFLAAESCTLNGEIIAAGGNYFSRVQVVEGEGVRCPGGVTPTAEWVAANWAAIADMGGARPFDSAMAALDGQFRAIESEITDGVGG